MHLEYRKYGELLDRFKTASPTAHYAVALIDIDGFHKHHATLSMSERVDRIHDVLSRSISLELIYLGLDEFAVFAENRPMEELLVELMQAKLMLTQELEYTFSAGIAEYPKHADDPKELVRLLEETVYQVKKGGRNRISFVIEKKMKLKSNYYTMTQLDRLAELAAKLGRSEASLLRESLDILLRVYEV